MNRLLPRWQSRKVDDVFSFRIWNAKHFSYPRYGFIALLIPYLKLRNSFVIPRMHATKRHERLRSQYLF